MLLREQAPTHSFQPTAHMEDLQLHKHVAAGRRRAPQHCCSTAMHTPCAGTLSGQRPGLGSAAACWPDRSPARNQASASAASAPSPSWAAAARAAACVAPPAPAERAACCPDSNPAWNQAPTKPGSAASRPGAAAAVCGVGSKACPAPAARGPEGWLAAAPGAHAAPAVPGHSPPGAGSAAPGQGPGFAARQAWLACACHAAAEQSSGPQRRPVGASNNQAGSGGGGGGGGGGIHQSPASSHAGAAPLPASWPAPAGPCWEAAFPSRGAPRSASA